MPEFLLEVYVSRTATASVDSAAARARDAAEQLTREGTPVRLERTIHVPDDETSFFLYEATCADDVREAARRAQLPARSVVSAVADSKGATR